MSQRRSPRERWQGLLDRARRLRASNWRIGRLTSAELFIGSFLSLITLGVLALKLLPGLYRQEPLGWIDAVFTATSAVCVTGLIVVDTATYFTFAGQVVLLLLIQLGGLGMLVLTSLIITALGGRPSVRSEAVTVGARQMIPHISTRNLVRDLLRFTFIFEGIGAVLLYGLWAPRLGWIEAIWPAVFHSISAFCNAGFSTNTTSLVEFSDSPMTLTIVSLLILVGGIGFITLEEVYQRIFRRPTPGIRMSVHSRLVLVTTAVLLIGGWILFAIFEWQGLLSGMSVWEKLGNSWFMSVTPRTAGFNSVEYSDATDSTNFLTIILMMIGGSPGSTAGGMKTTTFALLGLQAWSRLRSHPTATFAHRSIPEETIQRAAGLFVITTGIVVVAVLLLAFLNDTMSASQPFLVRLFEAASAFNTVGLSMGMTPELSVASRWLVIVLMFSGRTGPLPIAAALIVRLSRQGKFRLAYEDVVVG